MANENRTKIDGVKEIIDRWRVENPGRHATPLSIRQMVVDLIGEYSLSRICRDLNLTMSNVKKWRVRLAEDRAFFESSGAGPEVMLEPKGQSYSANLKEKERVSTGVPFLELGNIVGSSQQTTVEWRRANGESMRLVGQMSAKQVEILVQRFLSHQR